MIEREPTVMQVSHITHAPTVLLCVEPSRLSGAANTSQFIRQHVVVTCMIVSVRVVMMGCGLLQDGSVTRQR